MSDPAVKHEAGSLHTTRSPEPPSARRSEAPYLSKSRQHEPAPKENKHRHAIAVSEKTLSLRGNVL